MKQISLSVNLPIIMEFLDYHEISDARNILKKISKKLKIKECGLGMPGILWCNLYK